MKPLIIASMIALIALAAPLGTQLWANDDHHPEKSGKAKKSATTKSKTQPQQKKKPAAKSNKSD